MVEPLSPLIEAELVKPAASLSFQAWPYQGFDDASAKRLNCQDTLPM